MQKKEAILIEGGRLSRKQKKKKKKKRQKKRLNLRPEYIRKTDTTIIRAQKQEKYAKTPVLSDGKVTDTIYKRAAK